jgi:H+-transporting ATPase
MLIAFDNAKVSPRPSRWDMKRVLVVSSMLALIGVVQSAGLLRILHHETHLDVPAIQADRFMQLVIAGHLLLFWTRSSGSFRQRPFPERTFFGAIMGTQLLAPMLAANSWLLAVISWSRNGIICAHNLAWLVAVDICKLGFYRMFDREAARTTTWQQWSHKLLDSVGGLHRK